MQRCFVCRSERAEEKRVDQTLQVDGRYVLVEGVPAIECQTCGERTYAPETAERVRALVHDAVPSGRTETLHVYAFAPSR